MGFALGLGSNLESSLGTLGSACVVLKEIPKTQVEVFELIESVHNNSIRLSKFHSIYVGLFFKQKA